MSIQRVKKFSAVTEKSTNTVNDDSSINITNIPALDFSYGWEIIPDCPAATAAGYTADDRSRAQVWYGPTADKKHFYYTAYVGSIYFPQGARSTILVCRYKSDGSLKYAVNCGDYSLDTGNNFFAPPLVIARVAPAIHKRTLYLVNGFYSNIGPQLYAINKKTGALKWAVGYYPPEQYLIDHPGSQMVTSKSDYSQYIGSNVRQGDQNIIVTEHMNETLIIIGTASVQNAFNTGFFPNNIHYNSYPYFSDQGFLFCLKDNGTTSELKWKAPTCAPELKIGDQIIKNGDPRFDPFPPGQNFVSILTYTSTTYSSPHLLLNGPNTGLSPIVQRVSINQSTLINSSLVWDFWQSLSEIYLDGSQTPLNLSQVLNLWIEKQSLGAPFNSDITAFLTPQQIQSALPVPIGGQHPLCYIKELSSGHIIDSEMDAMGLNYYGCSTWGAPVSVDSEKNIIYFETGQAHSIPFSELQYFALPSHNYRSLKQTLVDASTAYSLDHSPSNLFALNQAKLVFQETLRTLSIDVVRSPRGQMSYPVACMACQLTTGQLLYGVRTIPSDTYTFLGNSNPVSLMYPSINTVDGDVSSGQHTFKNKRVGCMTKSGVGVILNIENLNPEIAFNHQNLSEVGVIYDVCEYLGVNSINGASNYQTALHKNQTIISLQDNVSFADGSVGTHNNFEEYVTSNGHWIPSANSYLCAFDIKNKSVKWISELQNFGASQIAICNDCVFTSDSVGSLYVHNAFTGAMLWKYNGNKGTFPMGGGIASACITDNQVFWINNYKVPIDTATHVGGGNGNCFKINNQIKIKKSHSSKKFALNHLITKNFTSWDSYPKLLIPSTNIPIINDTVVHSWYTSNNSVYVDVVHTLINPSITYTGTFQLKNDHFEKNKIKFIDTTQNLKYLSVKMINTKTYVLKYKIISVNLSDDIRYASLTIS